MAVAGCSAHVSVGGSPTLDNPDKTVAAALYQAVGQHPKSVTCPSDIAAKAGKTFRCTLTASDGTRYGVTVTEQSVTGSTVRIHVQVDRHPLS